MSILTDFLDIVYPPRCHICQKFLSGDKSDSPYFCKDCLDDFNEISGPLCTICGVPFESLSEEDHICEACLRRRPYYDRLCAPYTYEGMIMDAVHQLKYKGKTHLARSLGLMLGSFAEKKGCDIHDFLIMPVPLHPKKLRERRFNQSLLLARSMSVVEELDIDCLSLRRLKNTKPQTVLSSREREKNVRNAFGIAEAKSLKGKKILLVDDVATTGSTMNECASVLKKAGCDSVLCLALARTALA